MPFTQDKRANQTVITTDATPTTIATIPIPTNGAVHFRVRVEGDEPIARDVHARVHEGVIKRIGSGAAVLVQTASILTWRDAGAATWGSTATASGNNLVITVTGQVGKTINWRVIEETFA